MHTFLKAYTAQAEMTNIDNSFWLEIKVLSVEEIHFRQLGLEIFIFWFTDFFRGKILNRGGNKNKNLKTQHF